MSENCSRCQDFQNNFSSITFVKAINSDEGIFQCHSCKQYYHYRRSFPGGSNDAMKTEMDESVWKISNEEAERLMSRESESLDDSKRGKCQFCGSTNTILTDVNFSLMEPFYMIKCKECGEESALDENQWTYGL